jgi:hypothetical protein
MPSATATSTSTPAPAERTAINSVLVYPDPIKAGEDMKFLVGISGCAQEITLRVYSAGYRRILDKTWTTGLSGREFTLDAPASYLSGLANGTYYYVLILKDCSGATVRSRPGKFIVLK